MKYRIFLLVACATIGDVCVGGVSETSYAKDALEPYVKDGRLAGAISVFYDNGRQEVACVGYADVAAKRKITLDDVYMQCSQTKGFCGVTAAKLIEEGKLSLDDPVSKYLPEFKELWVKVFDKDDVRLLRKATNAVTVGMCLSHMGGFPFEISAKQWNIPGGGWSGGAPLRIAAAIAAASPLNFEPGTHTGYSNTGIDIAAAVVEVVTGKKWEEYLRQVVLDPLEMKSSSFWPTDEQLRSQVEMYECVKDAPAVRREQNPWQQRPYNGKHVFASAGAGLWTTANDQLKFYKMLMNLGVGENGVRILREDTVKSILAKSIRPKGIRCFANGELEDSYSLGLCAPLIDGEDQWFGHGGAWGTNCMVNWHRRQLKLFVVQISGGPCPWQKSISDAADKFFKASIDDSGSSAYTGRTK